jgi:hypothetical protein
MITIRYVDAYKETLLRKNWSLHGINPKAQLMVKWLTVNGNTWNIPTDKSENKKNLQLKLYHNYICCSWYSFCDMFQGQIV